jgi:hypothetical protein
MMSRKAESAEINSQHVPLRQNAEEKGRGKGLRSGVGRLERMKRDVV